MLQQWNLNHHQDCHRRHPVQKALQQQHLILHLFLLKGPHSKMLSNSFTKKITQITMLKILLFQMLLLLKLKQKRNLMRI